MRNLGVILISVFLSVVITSVLVYRIVYRDLSVQHNSDRESLSRLIKHERARQLTSVRAVALNIDSKLRGAKDNYQLALALRDHIYRRVRLEKEKEKFDYEDYFQAYLSSVSGKRIGHICDGYANLYLIVLEAFSIPSRGVVIFDKLVENDKQMNVHASVEIFDGGKWIAMDPTFNVSFEDQQKRKLGWFEIAELIANGKRVIASTDGFQTLPNRSLDEYYISIQDLTKYVITYAARLNSTDGVSEVGIQTWPSSWDGVVTNKTYGTVNLKGPTGSGFFEVLNAGLLR